MTEVTEANALQAIDQAARLLTPYPGGVSGRGIVICGGGSKYFPCAWVCIRRLRDLACKLPIELWYLGRREMTSTMRALIEPLGVNCIDATQPRGLSFPPPIGGYQLKAYAMLHSAFEEVLLLDADNVPLVDPERLFEAPPYQQYGAIFWPDYGQLDADRSIWRITGVDYQPEPEFESGQLLVDKRRCWQPLQLALWMNQHSSFWYRHIHGDKDTFHIAWRKLHMPYAMPQTPCFSLQGTMCQHDFDGRRIFQHRNFDKWTLDDPNPRIEGFLDEGVCLEHLERLRQLWHDRPRRDFDQTRATSTTFELARELCHNTWQYTVKRGDNIDSRRMSLSLDGRVAMGVSDETRGWNLEERHTGPVLAVFGKSGLTALLDRKDSTTWRGRTMAQTFHAVELKLMCDAKQ